MANNIEQDNMAFKLRSQSPLRQKNGKTQSFEEYTKKRFGEQKGYKETPTLSPSGKTSYKVTKNGKDITGSKDSQKYKAKQKMENLEKVQDYETTNKPNVYMADPTGMSSWGDAKRGFQHIGMMASTGDWKKDRLLKDALDIASAVPLVGKASAVKTGLNLVKKAAPKASKVSKVVKAVKNSKLTPAAATAAGDQVSEAISNKNKNKKR